MEWPVHPAELVAWLCTRVYLLGPASSGVADGLTAQLALQMPEWERATYDDDASI
jgi:hypothetical protein